MFLLCEPPPPPQAFRFPKSVRFPPEANFDFPTAFRNANHLVGRFVQRCSLLEFLTKLPIRFLFLASFKFNHTRFFWNCANRPTKFPNFVRPAHLRNISFRN